MILARTRIKSNLPEPIPQYRVYVNKSKKQTIICLIHDLVHTYYFKQTLMQVRRAQHTLRITSLDYLHLMGLVENC